MLTVPPIPTWQAVHPLVVHFPIALLLTAPLFVVIGMFRKPERSFPFLIAARILMGMGTAATYVASASGEAAAGLAERNPQAAAVLEAHEELAVTTELAFTSLTLIFASILFVPRVFKVPATRAVSVWLPAVFLVFYATGALSLANTAHQGGRLVHELGIQAQTPAERTLMHSANCR